MFPSFFFAFNTNVNPVFHKCIVLNLFLYLRLQTHYVISEGQTELETKQNAAQNTTQAHTDHLEEQAASQPTTTQYIITTTTNGSGASEVHITKP